MLCLNLYIIIFICNANCIFKQKACSYYYCDCFRRGGENRRMLNVRHDGHITFIFIYILLLNTVATRLTRLIVVITHPDK